MKTTLFNPLRWLNGRRLVIGVPMLWLAITFLLPFLIVLRISFVEMGDAGDPFGTLVSYVDGILILKMKVSNYLFIVKDDLYLLTYLSSLKYAAGTTLLCLLIGYPFAYFMARAKPTVRPVLMKSASPPLRHGPGGVRRQVCRRRPIGRPDLDLAAGKIGAMAAGATHRDIFAEFQRDPRRHRRRPDVGMMGSAPPSRLRDRPSGSRGNPATWRGALPGSRRPGRSA